MKRMGRIGTILLTCVLVLALLPVAAWGAQAGLSNFKKVNDYTTDTFNDVPAGKWYAENVQIAYELGLVKGSSAVSFSPDGKMNIASVIALASRLHSIYHTGAAEFEQGTPWYAVYVDYALENGIISRGQFDNYNADATRREFAAILAKALPAEALEPFNTVEDGAIPDVAMGSANSADIYMLYRAGILTGNDSRGTFAPESTIDRASVSTIVTRMAVSAMRRGVTLKLIPVTGVELDRYSAEVEVGKATSLTASVLPADATANQITWSTSDPAVATVSNNGAVKGVAKGTAEITATAANGMTAVCTVTVKAAPVAVTGVTVNKTLSVVVGKTATLTATVQPADAANKAVTWKSSDTSVATVSGTGKVTGVKAGTATITVTTANGKTATCAVTVRAPGLRDVLSAPYDTEQQISTVTSDRSNIYFKGNFYTGRNSADGIILNWAAKNTGSKTIKYLTFTAVFYNAVGDKVPDTISGKTEKGFRITGPIEPGEALFVHSVLGYSATCQQIKITDVTIEYMDGSKISGSYNYATTFFRNGVH